MSRIENQSQYKNIILNQTGVTLVEMMVYTVIAGMLLGMAVTAFLGQNRSYNRQEVIAEIQQNIRGASEQMASDIRLAGVGFFEDPTTEAFGFADNGHLTINQWPDDFYFSGSSGDTSEQVSIHYRLNGTDLGRAITDIGQTADTLTDAYFRPIAENIDDFRLEYQLESGGYWRWEGDVASSDLDQIRSVKIMILGGSRESAFNPTDSTVYDFPLDEPGETHSYPAVPGTSYDGYKRIMSTVVQARNNRE